MGIDVKIFPDDFALILSEAKEGNHRLSTLRAAWIKNSPTSSKLKIVKTFSPDQIDEELEYCPELKQYAPQSITIKL